MGRRIGADDRAQALQVGAVLLLGILVLALTLYQATVVPQQNKQVEFDAYLEASNDLEHLRDDLFAAGTRGALAEPTVKTGARYPPRTVAINPPPATGRLETRPRNVTLYGAKPVGGEHANVRAFFEQSNGSYPNDVLRFRPGYNEFDGPPIVVGSLAAYRDAGPSFVRLSDQSLVSGDTITLVTVAGDVNAGGYTTPLSVKPVSTSTRSVAVRGNDGSFTVTYAFDSAAAATRWNGSYVADSLREEVDAVEVNATDDTTVDVVFSGTHELRIARVALTERGGSATDPKPEYIVATDGNGTALASGQTGTLAVEVRDRYNNPVDGVAVTFDSDDGAFTTSTVATNSEGRASVRFTPTTAGATATASFAGSDAPLNETTFVLGAGGNGNVSDGTQSDINPYGEGALVLVNSTTVDCSNNPGRGNSVPCQVNITLQNRDPNQSQNITEMRFNFYSVDLRPSDNDPEPPASLTVDGETLYNGGMSNDSVRIEFGSGESKSVALRFQDSAGDPFAVSDGDFFVISVIIDDGEDTATYFIAPQPPETNGLGGPPF